jgi:hypothetical protein
MHRNSYYVKRGYFNYRHKFGGHKTTMKMLLQCSNKYSPHLDGCKFLHNGMLSRASFWKGYRKVHYLAGFKEGARGCMNLHTTTSSTRASTVGSVVGSGVGTYDVFHWERMMNTNFCSGWWDNQGSEGAIHDHGHGYVSETWLRGTSDLLLARSGEKLGRLGAMVVVSNRGTLHCCSPSR